MKRLSLLFFYLMISYYSFANDSVKLSVGLKSGLLYIQAKEIVESQPESASPYLSCLTWKTPAMYIGASIKYQPWNILNLKISVQYAINSIEWGELENLDFIDPGSTDITHSSLSNVSFWGLNWVAEIAFRLYKRPTFNIFISLGYRGYYNLWKAYGGEYNYPTESGSIAKDTVVLEYYQFSQIPYIGINTVFNSFEKYYFKIGADFSYFPFINDKDSHALRETQYYNEYRLGWNLHFNLKYGIRLGQSSSIEFYYTLYKQLELKDTNTKIKTPTNVYIPEEKPNYQESLHTIGIRFEYNLF